MKVLSKPDTATPDMSPQTFIKSQPFPPLDNMQQVLDRVESMEDEMVKTLANICRIPAIAPESGGDGEAKKAHYLEEVLRELGFHDIENVKAPDRRVSAGFRPNLIVTVAGEDEALPPLWIVSHIDVVPEGDLSKWDSEPYSPIVRDGKLYGRGVEDNGQSLVASIFAVKAIQDSGMKPRRTVKLCFVADEEVGSKYGIQFLVEGDLFGKDDLICVPDFGEPDGSGIEVVEKAHLQVKVVTKGKQVHASRPNKGVNAFVAASRFVDRITTELYSRYDLRDELFAPPNSTFECTKKEANVPNINTVPGEDVFYMDCRVLPAEDLDEIISVMKDVAQKVSIETGAAIELQEVRATPAPPATPVDSPIVVNLMESIREIYEVEPRPMGIGGGTCAAIFRDAGLSAAVWSTNEETAHEPNECIPIKNLVNDAKIFALLALK